MWISREYANRRSQSPRWVDHLGLRKLCPVSCGRLAQINSTQSTPKANCCFCTGCSSVDRRASTQSCGFLRGFVVCSVCSLCYSRHSSGRNTGTVPAKETNLAIKRADLVDSLNQVLLVECRLEHHSLACLRMASCVAEVSVYRRMLLDHKASKLDA